MIKSGKNAKCKNAAGEINTAQGESKIKIAQNSESAEIRVSRELTLSVDMMTRGLNSLRDIDQRHMNNQGKVGH